MVWEQYILDNVWSIVLLDLQNIIDSIHTFC